MNKRRGPRFIPAGRCSAPARRRGRRWTITISAAIQPARRRIYAGAGRGAVEAGCHSPRPSTTRSAPAQHELAPVFTTANIATDHNQLTMETDAKASPSGTALVCLLHEKPFAGVNGSGKHNNWSLSTDTGRRICLSRAKTPLRKRAVPAVSVRRDPGGGRIHQDLLRISAAMPDNDHRLGGDEAPPAIISMYPGRAS